MTGSGRGRARASLHGWRRSILVGLAIALLLTAPDLASADRVRLLTGAEEAAVARVELVLGAEREVLVSSFIVGDEPLSLTALALLRDAARRGVRVRLLVDAQWNKMPEAIVAHLRDEGVDVRIYHPWKWRRLGWVTRRLHDKLLVIDGERLVAGGRNVESPYFGLGSQLERRDYLDVDLLVDGDAAAEARSYFEALWESAHVRDKHGSADREARRQAAATLDEHAEWLRRRIDRALVEGVPVGRLLPVGDVAFYHDPVGRKGRAPGVAEALEGILRDARREVLIESPYLIPTPALERELAAAIDRGVRVRILTNSLRTTDNLWAQAGYVGERRQIVRSGIELWEYAGPESLHAKTAVVDCRRSVVASFNLDPRSQRLNTEVALVVDDEPLAFELAGWMDGHLQRAVRIDDRGWPEGADGPFPGVSALKRFRLFVRRLLAPLVRGQL